MPPVFRQRISRRFLRNSFISLLLLAALPLIWTWWAERHPREERNLRLLVHDQLLATFPEAMHPDDGWHGLYQQTRPDKPKPLQVVLVHGLDEPGTIWDDLVPALKTAGFTTWEFRYPNDQGIDRSANYLASHWQQLPSGDPVILIGHSMGGLVIRDFVTRLHQPLAAGGPAGPRVAGIILAGTPNQGSEWARMRFWLEFRDHFSGPERPFSLLAPLRDGTGEAKLDLRPGSGFLQDLNSRPWPREIPVFLIGGILLPPAVKLTDILPGTADGHGKKMEQHLEGWWSKISGDLGDGVVPLASVPIPGMPPPLILQSSHRGLLLRILPGDGVPPAIAPILQKLETWSREIKKTEATSFLTQGA